MKQHVVIKDLPVLHANDVEIGPDAAKFGQLWIRYSDIRDVILNLPTQGGSAVVVNTISPYDKYSLRTGLEQLNKYGFVLSDDATNRVDAFHKKVSSMQIPVRTTDLMPNVFSQVFIA